MIDKTTGFLSVDLPVIAAAPPRRRVQLYTSCSVNALLAMPAALSIGIMLAGPAGAQTTITSSSNVVLSNYEGITNFINDTGHQINGSPIGIYGNTSNFWTVTNAGTVNAEGEGNSYGIEFRNGGSIGNTGSIGGGSYGIYVKGNAGTLSNTGTITGGKTGAEIMRNGNVVNDGLIEGTNEGLYMYGQSFMNITNQSEGTITGARGLEMHYNETLDNAGVIAGTSGLGMYLAGGGMLTNESTGTISGTGTAIRASFVPQGVLNDGLISSSEADGIDFMTGGTLTNALSGTIQGAQDGVYAHQGALLVQNSGLISAASGDYGVANFGGFTSIDNAATGTIAGGTAGIVLAQDGSGTIDNLGTITGGAYGVSITGASAYVNNQASGDVAGYISAGSVGVLLSGAEGTVNNAGMILADNTSDDSATGVYLSYGGRVNNQAGASILGYTEGVYITGGRGILFNSGTINVWGNGSNGIGVFLQDGYVSNAPTGTIFGGSIGVAAEYSSVVENEGGITGETFGVSLRGGGYLNNSGSIFGATDGVLLNGYGTVINSGTITGIGGEYFHGGVILNRGGNVTNTTQGVMTGYTGLYASGNLSLLNGGTISGSGTGGYGVLIYYGNGSITNQEGGLISGPKAGLAVYGYDTSLNLTNAGVIKGEQYGVRLYTAVFTTVVNTGTIEATGYDMHGTGVMLGDGGYLNNAAGGMVYGYGIGVSIKGQAGTVVNAGMISGLEAGVALSDGGTVTNTAGGTITSARFGISDMFGSGPDLVVNAGSIYGGTFGVALSLGTVVNQAQGVITGGSLGAGVEIGDVTNATGGTISGGYAGVFVGTGNVTNADDGVISSGDLGAADGSGTITNAAGGFIEGHVTGVRLGDPNDVSLTGASLLNAGTVSGTSYGVSLSAGGTITNNADGVITSPNLGIFTTSGSALVLNSGSIYGGDDALALNTGTIVNQAGGTITGEFIGVYLASGSVTNATGGTIWGRDYGLYVGTGNVANAGGLISGLSAGVVDTAGTVTNAAGGTIQGGGTGVELGGARNTVVSGNSLVNDGTISGTAYGVQVYGAGYVGNTGSITGGRVGVSGNSAAVMLMNEGLVTGGNFGVSLATGGTIANSAAGTISGGENGIYGQGATIQNAGMVTGTSDSGIVLLGGQLTNLAGGTINGGDFGLFLSDGATASNAGVISDSEALTHAGALLLNGAALRNLAGGTITGDTGVIINGDDGTLFNAGTIIGTDGNAIAVGPNIDPAQITLATGSAEIGTIDGGGTDGQIFLTGHDTLNNTIADFGAGSALDVARGASWTASGNWTIADVTNDGTFEPGVIGTALTLNGNFTQSATGVLQVIVTPKVTSQFIVNGSVALAGKLTYAFAPGTYVPGKETFLTATQGITGGFSEVDYLGDVPAALKHATGAVATAADLALTAGPTPPSAPTPPAPPSPPAPPKPPMLVTPADDGLYADAAQAAAMATQDVSAGLLDHATMQADGGAGGAACAAASGVAQANAGAAGASMAARMTTAVASAFCGAGGWVAATGTAMTVDGTGYADGYRTTSGGVLAGMDMAVPGMQARLGVAVGYDNADLKDSEGGKVDIGTTRIGLYGTQMLGRFTLAGDFMVGLASDTATRPTGIGPAHARFDGADYAGGVQISTAMMLRGFELAPAAGIRIANTADNAFAESGGGPVADFAVTGEAVRDTSIQPYATLGISRPFFTPSFVAITPSVSIGYMAEAGSFGKSTTVTAPDGTGFATTSPMLDGGAAALGAGITAGKGDWSLYAHYTAYVAGHWTAQAGEAGLQVKF